MKTRFAKEGEVERKWYVVDAEGKTLGRLATRIAVYLRGKQKPQFTPNADTGDFIIVVNAEKVKVTGKKLDDKMYRSHSGYIGGLKEESLRHLLGRKPEKVISEAVWGMLPKGRLGKTILTKLKVYKGPDHPHAAQKPLALNLTK